MKEFKVERPKVDTHQPHLDIGQKLVEQRVVDMVNYGHPTPVAPPAFGDIYSRRMLEDPTNGDVYTYVTKVDNHGNATVLGQRWVAATGQYEEVRQGGYDQKYSVDALKQGKIDLTEHKIGGWRTQITEWGVTGATPDRRNSSGPDAASALAQEFAAKQQVAFVYDKDGKIIDGPGVNGRSMPVYGQVPSRGQAQRPAPASRVSIDAPTQSGGLDFSHLRGVAAAEPRIDDAYLDSLGSRTRGTTPTRSAPARMPAPRVPDNTPALTVPPLKESLKGIAAGLKVQAVRAANPESLQIKLGQRGEYSEAGRDGADFRNRIRASRLGRKVMRFKTPEEKAAARATRAALATAQPTVIETPVVVTRAPMSEPRPATPIPAASAAEPIAPVTTEPTQVLPDRSQEILDSVGALRGELEADRRVRAGEIKEALRIFERAYSLQVAALLSQILDENRDEMNRLDGESRGQIQEALRRIAAFEGAIGDTNETLKGILTYLERSQETQQVLGSGVSQVEIFSGFTLEDVVDAPIADNELSVLAAESMVLEARDLAESEDLSDGEQAVDAFSALEDLAQSLGFINPEMEDDQPEGDLPLDPAIEAAAAQAWQRTGGDQPTDGRDGLGSGSIPVGVGVASDGSSTESVGSSVAVLDIPEADEAEAAAASVAQAIPSPQTATWIDSSGKPIWESDGWTPGAPDPTWATSNGGPQSAGFARVAPVTPVTDRLDGRMPLSSAELRRRGGLSGSEVSPTVGKHDDILEVVRAHGGTRASRLAHAQLEDVIAATRESEFDLLGAYGIDGINRPTPEAIINSFPIEIRGFITPQKINGFKSVYGRDPLRAKNMMIEYIIAHAEAAGVELTEEQLSKYFA